MDNFLPWIRQNNQDPCRILNTRHQEKLKTVLRPATGQLLLTYYITLLQRFRKLSKILLLAFYTPGTGKKDMGGTTFICNSVMYVTYSVELYRQNMILIRSDKSQQSICILHYPKNNLNLRKNNSACHGICVGFMWRFTYVTIKARLVPFHMLHPRNRLVFIGRFRLVLGQCVNGKHSQLHTMDAERTSLVPIGKKKTHKRYTLLCMGS